MNARWPLGISVVLAACGRPALATPPQSPPPVLKPSGDEDALELRLSAAAETLRDQGFVRGAFYERGFLPPNGRATHAIVIEPKTCARFVAVATPSMVDLDASLYRADGHALLEDDSSDARPSLILCAGAERVEGYYSLHAYQGVGSYASAQFVRPSSLDDDLITVDSPSAPSPLNELAKTLHKRGFDDLGSRVEVKLIAGHALRLAVSAKPGECYTLAAESSALLSGVALRLIEGEQELGHGVAGDQVTSLQFCSNRPRELELEVNAAAGEGPIRIARFKAQQGAVGGAHSMWLGEPSPSRAAWHKADETRAAVTRELAQDPKSGVSESRPLSQGAVVELDSRKPLGECERWQALLEPGLSQATLRVESSDGTVLGEVDSEAMIAELTVCRKGPVRVSVIGRTGFGAVTLVGRAVR